MRWYRLYNRPYRARKLRRGKSVKDKYVYGQVRKSIGNRREAGGVAKILCIFQWTSSGKSPKVNAEGLSWKNNFQDLSLFLLFFQSVKDGAREAYAGQAKRTWLRECSTFGPQNLQ